MTSINGLGSAVLPVCAVWDRTQGIFSLSASTSYVFDCHLNNYSNHTLFSLDACSIVSERVPALFALRSLIHAGFWGDSALPSPQTGFFQPPLQELSPWLILVADPEFATIECLPDLVIAQRLGQVGKNLVGERECSVWVVGRFHGGRCAASAVSVFFG